MRLLLVLAIACTHESSQPVGKIVVARSDLLETEQSLELAALREPAPFIAGCQLANVDGWAALQCPKLRVFAKFHCRDHTGPAHPLSLMLGADSYTLHCR